MATTTKPISVAWCTDASGVVPFDATIQSTSHDLTHATAARLIWVDAQGWVGPAGATVSWAMTLKSGAAQTATQCVMTHLLVTGDVVAAMVGQSIRAHVWCTVSGVEYPDIAEPFLIPILE